nr:hypothetical protein [Tanacetum cinerariifolium]
ILGILVFAGGCDCETKDFTIGVLVSTFIVFRDRKDLILRCSCTSSQGCPSVLCRTRQESQELITEKDKEEEPKLTWYLASKPNHLKFLVLLFGVPESDYISDEFIEDYNIVLVKGCSVKEEKIKPVEAKVHLPSEYDFKAAGVYRNFNKEDGVVLCTSGALSPSDCMYVAASAQYTQSLGLKAPDVHQYDTIFLVKTSIHLSRLKIILRWLLDFGFDWRSGFDEASGYHVAPMGLGSSSSFFLGSSSF